MVSKYSGKSCFWNSHFSSLQFFCHLVISNASQRMQNLILRISSQTDGCFYRFFLHHMKDVLVTSYLLHSSIILRCSWINILFSWSATMASCWRIRLLWVRRMSSSSVSRRRRVDSWLEIRLDNLETEKKIATIFTNQKQTKRKYLKHLNQWS